MRLRCCRMLSLLLSNQSGPTILIIMFTSSPKSIGDDLVLNASLSHDVANEGESQAAAEEEIQLHANESSYTDRLLDSSKGFRDGQVDEIHNSETNSQLTHDSRNSPQVANIGTNVTENEKLMVIVGDRRAPSCTRPAEDESYSSITHERKERMSITEHLNSPPVHVSRSHDFVNESKPPPSHPDIEVAIETVDCEDDEPPPLPLSLRSQKFEDGPKSKQNVPIALERIDGEDRPVPFSIYFADTAIAEKSSRIDAAKDAVLSDQSATSIDQPLQAVIQLDHSNHGQALLNQEVAQRSRAESTSINLDHWVHRIPSVSRRSYILPRADSNALSWSARNDRAQGDDDEDVILVPEAFLADANTLDGAPGVEVAELVEPDLSRFSFKKRYACMVAVFIVVTVIALGLTINSRGNAPYLELHDTQSSFSTPSRSSFDVPSSQPSVSLRYAIERNVLQRNATFDEMGSTDSRIFALNWISDKDEMNLVASDSNLFQRYVLALLAFEFSNSRWLAYIDECNWIGVECDANGQVITLELTGNRLDGTIPPEIGRLQYLQNLLLSENVLHGTLPSELGNLKNISKLTLDANNFIGTIPSEIYSMKKLTVLSLSANDFTGTLLSELGNLIMLTDLSFSDNQFMGTLPPELSNLKELTALNFSMNEFTGTLPSEIGKLSKLTEFHFSSNEFTGTFPSEVGILKNLTGLTFYSNKFTGTVPSELGNLNMLTQLKFDHNRFRSTLPSALGNLNKLTQFYVHNNQLTGTLPSELGNLREMKLVSLSQNRFTGILPTEIGNMQELTLLRLNDNQFTGTLPPEFGRLYALQELYLFTNQLSRTIPMEFQNLTSLTSFLIHFNQLDGPLSSWIGDFTNLMDLRIGGNMFTGTLPSELRLLTKLVHLQIDSNKFTGSLPSWIGDLRSLKHLWINDNQFTGTFPPEIVNNLDLTSLCLRNNELTGSLPADIQIDRDCPW